VNCWSCEAENPGDARFCFSCGSRLVADPETEALCRSCAAPLPLDARFCGYCGTAEPLTDPSGSEPSSAQGDEDEEETVLRDGLDVPGPIIGRPGPPMQGKAKTQDTPRAGSTALAERLGQAGASGPEAGTSAKKGPSARKPDGQRSPPPPPIGVRKSGGGAPGQQMPPPPGIPSRVMPGPPGTGPVPGRTPGAAPPSRARSPAPPPPTPGAGSAGVPRPPGSPLSPGAGAAGAPRPPGPPGAPQTSGAGSAGVPRPPGPPGAPPPTPPPTSEPQAVGAPRPGGLPPPPDEPDEPPLLTTAPDEPDEPPLLSASAPSEPVSNELPSQSDPDGGLSLGMLVKPSAVTPGRTNTEPQRAVYAGPSRGETAAILAPPEGWPDITDELAEVRFAALMGVDDEVRDQVLELRERHRGHPDVDSLAAELGIEFEPTAMTMAPPPTPIEPPAPTPVEGPPPRGRYPVADAGGPASSGDAGAPAPAAVQTSDELLDDDEADEFDDLETSDVDLSDIELTGPTMAPRFDASDMYDEVSGPLDVDELERKAAAERERRGPASYRERQPTPSDAQDAGVTLTSGRNEGTLVTLAPGANENTNVGPVPAGFDRTSVTLAPGRSVLEDHERSVTLPPGSVDAEFVDDEPTYAGDSPLGSGAMDDEEPEEEARPGMTAPDRESDSAAASGSFRVSDLDLDDLPDLDQVSSDDVQTTEMQTTEEGTVVARAPLPPAPYGQGGAPVPVMPVRLVMLGPRGEAVTERHIDAGGFLELGRSPDEPWAEDHRMEEHHARLFPAPGGVVVDDFGRPSGVYTQIFDTIVVEDGDEFKVGQARLALQRFNGTGGSWGQLTLVRHDSTAPETYPLLRNEIIIGREEGDIILPDDTFVSGDHCRFIFEGNAIYLEDLGSSNGTYIRVRAGQCVAFGGLLLVGHTQFRVLAG